MLNSTLLTILSLFFHLFKVQTKKKFMKCNAHAHY